MKSITSDSNPGFRRWLRLAGSPRAAREHGETLAEGVHLAQCALQAGFPIRAAIACATGLAREAQEVFEQIDAAVPRYALARALYDRISPVEQGAGLLLVLGLPTAPLPARSASDMVYLDGVQDPGNVGTIIRTAAAAGVRHVLAAPGTAALWSPRVLRAGMGAHFRIGLHEHVTPEQLPAVLAGRWICATAHDAQSLWSTRLPDGALGWIFGAEGSGPSAAALEISSQRVRIPASSAVESLNVAAAAAVCLFETLRRRSSV